LRPRGGRPRWAWRFGSSAASLRCPRARMQRWCPMGDWPMPPSPSGQTHPTVRIWAIQIPLPHRSRPRDFGSSMRPTDPRTSRHRRLFSAGPGIRRPGKTAVSGRALAACFAIATPIPAGSYQAQAFAFPGYRCETEDCFPGSDGVIDQASPVGTPTAIATTFSTPFGSDELVLEISILGVADA